METIWKPIKNYEGLYEVSNTGLVRSVERDVIGKNGIKQHFKSRILKGNSLQKGHLQVQLRKDGIRKVKLIHRLVAEAFLDEFTEDCVIDHIDGKPSNNNISNLRITTQGLNNFYRDENWEKIRIVLVEKVKTYGYEELYNKILNL